LTHKINWITQAKKNAAKEAIKYIEDRSIVGLGSGSTVAYAIKALGEKIKKEKLSVIGIPTSYQSFLLAIKHGIKISTLDEYPNIDLTIDGADQIDTHLNLIKGMGGALFREKIVALASKNNIIVADETKNVKNLGDNNHPVPIEVLPFALSQVKNKLKRLGGKPILREGNGKVGPIITDNGNVIFDTIFGSIKNPDHLNTKIKMITGVVETGLFLKTTNIIILGTSTSIKKIERKNLNKITY
jgi:ribose 5-phosphate isomerase A